MTARDHRFRERAVLGLPPEQFGELCGTDLRYKTSRLTNGVDSNFL
jgi:hypothetical protein